MERPEWHAWAACRGMADFFEMTAEAQAARCAVCPTTEECRRAGLKEPYGVWDGETKPGLPPVVDLLADRIVDEVTVRPYKWTGNELIRTVKGSSATRFRATVRRLVDEGRLTSYETLRGSGRGRGWAIVYGPGEVRA